MRADEFLDMTVKVGTGMLLGAVLGLMMKVAFAQSEQFIDQEKPIKQLCVAQARAINNLVMAKHQGWPLEAVIDAIPQDWSPAMKTDAAHAAAQVYALEGIELQKWYYSVMDRCMTNGGHGAAKE